MPVRLTDFEYRQQTRDLKQVAGLAADIDEFQTAALAVRGHISLDDSSESATIDVRHVSEVDDEIDTAGGKLATHDITKLGLGFSRNLGIRLENCAGRHKMFDDAHGNSPYLRNDTWPPKRTLLTSSGARETTDRLCSPYNRDTLHLFPRA